MSDMRQTVENRVAALLQDGQAAARAGQKPKARREFRAALALRPDWAEANNGLGFLYMNQGRNEEALAHLDKAAQLDPSSIDAHMHLGYMHRRLQAHGKAITEFKRVLAIDPDNPWARNGLGACYYRQGLYSQAITCYWAALDSDRYDAPEQAHLNLGFVHRRRKHYVSAAHHCRKAIELNPKFAYAHSQLAQILYHQKRYDEARKHVKAAQDLGLEVNPEFLKELGKEGP